MLPVQAPLDLNLPVTSVRQVCGAIEAQTKQKVDHGTIGDVPILIRYRGEATPLLEKMAYVTGATVERTSTGWRFTRTAAMRAEDLRAEQAELAKRIEPALKKYAAELTSKQDWSDQAVLDRRAKLAEKLTKDWSFTDSENPYTLEVNIGGVQNPASVLLAGLISKLRPEQLAQVLPDRMAIFSERPNAAQLPLGVDLGDARRAFVTAHNRMAQGSLPGVPANVTVFAGFPWRQLQPNDVAKVNLRVKRNGPVQFTLQVIAISAEGELLGQQTGNFSAESHKPMPIQLSGDEKISWTPEGRQVATWLSAATDDSMPQVRQSSNWGNGRSWDLAVTTPPFAIPDQDRQRLIEIDRDDPLEAYVAPPFRQIAEARNLNLVARFRDSDAISLLAVPSAQPKSVTDFGKEPVYQNAAERGDVPRREWAKVTAELSKGEVTADTGLEFASRTSKTMLVERWLRLIDREGSKRFWDSFEALRFVALMPKAVRSSSQVAFSQAPDAFRDYFSTRWLNDWGEGSSSMSRNDPPRAPLAAREDLSEGLSLGGAQLVARPTQGGESLILQARRDRELATRWISPFGVGRNEAMRNVSQYSEYSDWMRPFSSYRAGKTADLGWELRVVPLSGGDPLPGIWNSLSFRRWIATGDWVTIDQLPEAYKKEIELGKSGNFGGQ
jgi:hypothetical protein